MKASAVVVGKVYVGGKGHTRRRVSHSWRQRPSGKAMVTFQWREGRAVYTRTISLAAFARWAVEEVAE